MDRNAAAVDYLRSHTLGETAEHYGITSRGVTYRAQRYWAKVQDPIAKREWELVRRTFNTRGGGPTGSKGTPGSRCRSRSPRSNSRSRSPQQRTLSGQFALAPEAERVASPARVQRLARHAELDLESRLRAQDDGLATATVKKIQHKATIEALQKGDEELASLRAQGDKEVVESARASMQSRPLI